MLGSGDECRMSESKGDIQVHYRGERESIEEKRTGNNLGGGGHVGEAHQASGPSPVGIRAGPTSREGPEVLPRVSPVLRDAVRVVPHICRCTLISESSTDTSMTLCSGNFMRTKG